MKLQQGVRLNGLKPEALLGLLITSNLCTQIALPIDIVSVADGKHDGGDFMTSSHYAGMSFDFRPAAGAVPSSDFVATLKSMLGDEFYVAPHKSDGIIHVCFMPRSN